MATKNIKRKINGVFANWKDHSVMHISFARIFFAMFVIFAALICVSPNLAYAKTGQIQGHIPLLAVAQTADSEVGSIADLYLEIVPGKGRVFLDTTPLTKFDTQISTRFAKQVACNYLEADCENYDFIYTINADTTIIGGPSAGAAITALTVSLLDNNPIKTGTTLTASINAGGLLGPVGSVKAKLEAASKDGINNVIISKGSADVEENNKTINLIEYGKKIGINVIEAADLDEAMLFATGKQYNSYTKQLNIDEDYRATMKNISEEMCKRSDELIESIREAEPEEVLRLGNYQIKTLFAYNENYKDAINLTKKAEKAMSEKAYYSAASFCFGANTKLRTLNIRLMNISSKEFRNKIEMLGREIEVFEEKTDNQPKETITQLQAYMIVKERVQEANIYLNKSKVEIDKNISGYVDDYSYAVERQFSAAQWSKFFDVEGKKYDISRQKIKDACENKINEATERISYVQYLIPTVLSTSITELGYAKNDKDEGEYEMCLFRASKAKAEADLVLSFLYITEQHVNSLVNNKLNAVEKVIKKSAEKNTFPLLGYSYYEFGKRLMDSGDSYSAALYLEYSMELSNLDIYFSEKEKHLKLREIRWELIVVFAEGIIVGIITTVIILFKRNNAKKSPNKRAKGKGQLRNIKNPKKP